MCHILSYKSNIVFVLLSYENSNIIIIIPGLVYLNDEIYRKNTTQQNDMKVSLLEV